MALKDELVKRYKKRNYYITVLKKEKKTLVILREKVDEYFKKRDIINLYYVYKVLNQEKKIEKVVKELDQLNSDIYRLEHK